jgi:hypothetical protein
MVLGVRGVIKFENSWVRVLRLSGLLQMFSSYEYITHCRCQVQHCIEYRAMYVRMKQQTFYILSEGSGRFT